MLTKVWHKTTTKWPMIMVMKISLSRQEIPSKNWKVEREIMKSTSKRTTSQTINCVCLKFQWIQIWISKCCCTTTPTLTFFISFCWCRLVSTKYWSQTTKMTHLWSCLQLWQLCTVQLSCLDSNLAIVETSMSHTQTLLHLLFRHFFSPLPSR